MYPGAIAIMSGLYGADRECEGRIYVAMYQVDRHGRAVRSKIWPFHPAGGYFAPMLRPPSIRLGSFGPGVLPACLFLYVYVFACFIEVASGNDGPLRDLSSGERAAIIGGSFGVGALAQLIPASEADSADYTGYHANSLDRWWRSRVHGGKGHQSNVIDRRVGSFIAPVCGGLTMALIDIDRREFSRDIPLFIAGAVTTGAVTTAVKRAVRRPRPYTQEGGVLPPGREASESYHTESFFSGHSSQAFFAAGFVNNRLRRHMRQQWRREEYRSWRWASPMIAFGWASFVGWSRMHADKHHFTDVATGALVGYAISEVYYRLAYAPVGTSGSTFAPGTPLLSVSVSF